MHNPAVCGVDDTVLQEDNFGTWLRVLRVYAEDVENIPIFSRHWVRFKDETVLPHNLLKVFIIVWIRFDILVV